MKNLLVFIQVSCILFSLSFSQSENVEIKMEINRERVKYQERSFDNESYNLRIGRKNVPISKYQGMRLMKRQVEMIENFIKDDFLVNDDSIIGRCSKEDPFVAMDANGNFVVTWIDNRNGNPDIYCQLYNPEGRAKGTNFKVNKDDGNVVNAVQDRPFFVMEKKWKLCRRVAARS